MRFLVKATVPVETGNTVIKAGKLGPTIQSILSDIRPEAVYFLVDEGKRTAYLFFDLLVDSNRLERVCVYQTPVSTGGTGFAIGIWARVVAAATG